MLCQIRTVLLLLAAASCSDAARILAVFPVTAPSHQRVFTSVTGALAARGHHITYVCIEPTKDMPDNHTVIELGKPDNLEEVFGPILKGFMSKKVGLFEAGNIWRTLGEFLVNATLSSPKLQAELKNPSVKYDLVMTELFFLQEGFVALGHVLNVPVVSVNAFGTHHFLNHITGLPANPAWVPNVNLGFTDRMTFLQRVGNTALFALQHVMQHLKQLPMQQAVVDRYLPGTPPLRTLLDTRLVLTLVNNHFSLFYPMPMSPNVVEIGGAHIKEKPSPLPQDLKEILDNAKEGVVFFSLGSNLRIQDLPKEKADAILNSLGSLKQQVLLKWTSTLPKNVPANVHIKQWLPQPDLLAHPNLRAFVTHGGLLSTQEAVYYGVPIVGVPVFGDQPYNVKLAVQKGFAVYVDIQTLTQESLTNALREILDNPKYVFAARRLSSVFRSLPQRPVEAAVFWVEHVLQHGGSHLRPSATELAWYQLLLLDVLVVLLAPLLLLGLLLSRLCRWCRAAKSPVTVTPKKKKA